MLDGVMCAGSVGVGLCDAGKAEKATLRPHACARMQFFPDMRVERSGHPCIGECWEIVCIFHLGFYSQSLETPVDDGMQDSHIRKKLRRAKEEGREYSKSDEK